MSLVFRRMTREDLPAVLEIERSSMPLPWSERAYLAELTARHSRPWVAEAEGRVAAVLVLWMVVDEAHIATLAVHPDFRRRGIASALLRFALDEAAEEGAVTALLEVRAGNESAKALYRRFGFEIVGKRAAYYKDNGEDALLMTLTSIREVVGKEIG